MKPNKEIQDETLCGLIKEYHLTYDQTLGYRRMTMYINRLNHFDFSEGYIHRLMQFMNIKSRIRRKKTNRKKVKPDYIAENILGRDFATTKPNEKWLTDVTEFNIPNQKGKIFLSPIMDLYDNSIITYKISAKNNNAIVFSMFDDAINKYPTAKPIFHSDRGFQYTNKVYKAKLEKQDITQSMSRPGKCIDNGPMEGFFGTLKSEMFHTKKYTTYDELTTAIHTFIDYYNNDRYRARLKNMAPNEFRAMHI